MITILLNTIALEPNRWTAGKVPYRPLVELLGPIARAGFDALEVWQNHAVLLDDAGLETLRETADRECLAMPVLGMYPAFHLEGRERDEEKARWDRMVRIMDTLGARVLKLMPGRVASADLTGDLWDQSVAFVQEALDRTADRGFPVPLEMHGGTVADSAESVLRFIGAVGSDRLKVCFQPMGFADTDGTIAIYDALAPHVMHMHVQGRAGDRMAALEESDIDYSRVLRRIFRGGFDGYVSIEFVRDCVVESPEQLNVEKVLANAARERQFIRRQISAVR
jgi:sugar phosphate isomerase/epimerase